MLDVIDANTFKMTKKNPTVFEILNFRVCILQHLIGKSLTYLKIVELS